MLKTFGEFKKGQFSIVKNGFTKMTKEKKSVLQSRIKERWIQRPAFHLNTNQSTHMKSLHLTTMKHYYFVVFSVAFVLIKKIKVFQNCIKKKKDIKSLSCCTFSKFTKIFKHSFSQ